MLNLNLPTSPILGIVIDSKLIGSADIHLYFIVWLVLMILVIMIPIVVGAT